MSIRVYQQISAGFPKEKILGQFDDFEADPEEVHWVWATAKQRYFGYQQHRRDVNRDSGKSFMLTGVGLLMLISLILGFIGWPTAGRQVGMTYMAIIGGSGALLYGAYVWLTAEPTDTRTDLG